MGSSRNGTIKASGKAHQHPGALAGLSFMPRSQQHACASLGPGVGSPSRKRCCSERTNPVPVQARTVTHLPLQVYNYSCWVASGSWLTHQTFISASKQSYPSTPDKGTLSLLLPHIIRFSAPGAYWQVPAIRKCVYIILHDSSNTHQTFLLLQELPGSS